MIWETLRGACASGLGIPKGFSSPEDAEAAAPCPSSWGLHSGEAPCPSTHSSPTGALGSAGLGGEEVGRRRASHPASAALVKNDVVLPISSEIPSPQRQGPGGADHPEGSLAGWSGPGSRLGGA